jgi:hypothetical protein
MPMLKMEGYMITPIQRMPRYELLLKVLLSRPGPTQIAMLASLPPGLWIELWAHVRNVAQELLKHTAGDDPGRGALDEALGLVQSINGYINEYVRSAERAQALVQIQSNMSGLKGGWVANVGRALPRH